MANSKDNPSRATAVTGRRGPRRRTAAPQRSWPTIREAVRARAKLTSKHQIVIPKPVRQELGLEAGDVLLLHAEDGILYAMREPDDWAEAWREGGELWRNVDVEAYIRELREDRDVEPKPD